MGHLYHGYVSHNQWVDIIHGMVWSVMIQVESLLETGNAATWHQVWMQSVQLEREQGAMAMMDWLAISQHGWSIMIVKSEFAKHHLYPLVI